MELLQVMKSLEKEVNRKDSEIEKLKIKSKRLSDQLIDKETHESDISNSKTTRESAELMEYIYALNKQIEMNRIESEAAEKTWEEKMHTLQNKLNDAETALKLKNSQKKALEMDFAELKRNYQKMIDDVSKAGVQVREKAKCREDKLAELVEMNASLTAQLASKDKEIMFYREHILFSSTSSDVEGDISYIRVEGNPINTSNHVTRTETEAIISKYEREINQLKSELAQSVSKSCLDASERRCTQIQIELESIKLEVVELMKGREREKLEMSINRKGDKSDDSRTDMSENIQTLQNNYNSLKAYIAESDEVFKRTVYQNIEMKQQLDEALARLKVLEDENKNLTHANDDTASKLIR